jgi:hypothetical protein
VFEFGVSLGFSADVSKEIDRNETGFLELAQRGLGEGTRRFGFLFRKEPTGSL